VNLEFVYYTLEFWVWGLGGRCCLKSLVLGLQLGYGVLVCGCGFGVVGLGFGAWGLIVTVDDLGLRLSSLGLKARAKG
jgi:hypothetical protein